MSQRSESSVIPVLLSLFVGAAAGALLVALNTNKPAHERDRQAKLLARRANRGTKAVGEDTDGLLADWKAHAVSRPEPEAP
jgi:hypothetical protein